MEALIQKYRASFPDKARKIEAAMTANDVAALLVLVHRLAGSSGSYGFQDLAELCQRIEINLQSSGRIPQDCVQDLINHLRLNPETDCGA